jgi:hypothetical protein
MGSGRDSRLVEWPEAAKHGAAVAITRRYGGVSEGPYESLNLGLHVGDDAQRVLANRERAAEAFRVELGAMVFAEQVHGAAATAVGAADRGRGTRRTDDAVPATDILVTTALDTTLAIQVADCVPLALLDPEARVLSAVHAGWRGTAAQVCARALQAMRALGARPERVLAYIGPGVDGARYQVDDAVYQAVEDAVAPYGLAPGVASPDGPGHWRLDLMAANRQQLLLAGVRAAHISDCGVTTADDAFFSDRALRPCGRFALLARLTDGTP